ncbi:hypothetical protein ABPG74_015374 [Tetrahymena malaccensis]
MAERSYQSIHVLVAEDDNFQRLALIDILTLCDYQVTAVENGRLARDELLKSDSNIDIVLLDLYMPEMDGIELLLLMQDHEHLKRIPVIMMSFDNEQERVAYCIANGAKDYLVKPLRIQNVKGLAKYVEYNPGNTSTVAGGVGLQSYKVIRMIGQGAGGSVELVQKRSDGQLFALKTISMKFMDDQQKKMAQQEIILLKVLVAPSIIRYYESFVENDSIHIIMEYAKEGALSDKISEHKQKGVPIDEETILYFTAQIIISVLFMHSKNILHRDIKTQNLFLTKENIVKLGDFGISKELGTNANAKTLVGTPYFMSPEVCSGENYGQKADIWAIGCTLYEMVMLKRPFDNDNLNILFNKIRFEPPPPLHENTSTEIRMLITFMLQKDPVKRPSVWDLAKIPIISKNIRKYYEEEAQDDPFLKEYIFSGPKNHPNINKNQPKDENKNTNENPSKTQDQSQNTNEEMFKALSSALSPYDQKISMFKVERNVINGKQIFQWIQENYPNYNTSQIVEMLNELVEKKQLHHIAGPLHQSDPKSLYRFQFDMPGIAANMVRVWNKAARPALQCLQGIIEMANEVLTEVTDKMEGKVLDEKLYQNKKYLKFLELVCELQKIYLQDTNEKERKCIFINLLQIMYFHQFMKQRYIRMRNEKKQKVTTLFETLASFLPFFNKSQDVFYYTIGNLQFTLDDIKHGIIRGNKTHKLSSFRQFQENDSRKQFVLAPDLRVLMLFKEENVIPTELKFIKLETIDQQLDEICNKFLSTYVYIDNIENDLTMHKIFQIYQSDFGPEPQDAIFWASIYTKTLGRRVEDLVENIKSGDIFVQYQEKFES